MLLCVVRFISLRFGLYLWLADWFVVGWLLLFVWFWLPFVGVCCCFAGLLLLVGFACFVVLLLLWVCGCFVDFVFNGLLCFWMCGLGGFVFVVGLLCFGCCFGFTCLLLRVCWCVDFVC